MKEKEGEGVKESLYCGSATVCVLLVNAMVKLQLIMPSEPRSVNRNNTGRDLLMVDEVEAVMKMQKMVMLVSLMQVQLVDLSNAANKCLTVQ